MILRISEPLSRALAVFVAIAIAVPLSYYSVRMAWAAYEAELETAKGLKRRLTSNRITRIIGIGSVISNNLIWSRRILRSRSSIFSER